jgi:hypothetical protein
MHGIKNVKSHRIKGFKAAEVKRKLKERRVNRRIYFKKKKHASGDLNSSLTSVTRC